MWYPGYMLIQYTKAIVVAINEERGIAYDVYDNSYRFTKDEFLPEDWAFLQEGSEIVYIVESRLEDAHRAFVRWEETHWSI